MSGLMKLLASTCGKSRLEPTQPKQATKPMAKQKVEVPQPDADDIHHCADPKLPADY